MFNSYFIEQSKLFLFDTQSDWLVFLFLFLLEKENEFLKNILNLNIYI